MAQLTSIVIVTLPQVYIAKQFYVCETILCLRSKLITKISPKLFIMV